MCVCVCVCDRLDGRSCRRLSRRWYFCQRVGRRGGESMAGRWARLHPLDGHRKEEASDHHQLRIVEICLRHRPTLRHPQQRQQRERDECGGWYCSRAHPICQVGVRHCSEALRSTFRPGMGDRTQKMAIKTATAAVRDTCGSRCIFRIQHGQASGIRTVDREQMKRTARVGTFGFFGSILLDRTTTKRMSPIATESGLHIRRIMPPNRDKRGRVIPGSTRMLNQVEQACQSCYNFDKVKSRCVAQVLHLVHQPGLVRQTSQHYVADSPRWCCDLEPPSAQRQCRDEERKQNPFPQQRWWQSQFCMSCCLRSFSTKIPVPTPHARWSENLPLSLSAYSRMIAKRRMNEIE